jgi:hypothetical protein
MGSVAVVVPDVLRSASDSSVFVVSLLSLSLSISSGSTVLQQVSNFGLFNMYLCMRLIISPAVIGTNYAEVRL